MVPVERSILFERQELRRVLFPFTSVERPDGHVSDRPGIQAAHVDVVSVGVGSGNVERLYTAVSAEKMLCNSGVEAISRKAIFPFQKSESGSWYGQPEVTRFTADRAIALGYENVLGRTEREAHASTMTSPGMRDHLISPDLSKGCGRSRRNHRRLMPPARHSMMTDCQLCATPSRPASHGRGVPK
jgi:hypothetical protein